MSQLRRIYDSWPALVLAGKSSQKCSVQREIPASFVCSEKISMKMLPSDDPEEIKDMLEEVVESVRKVVNVILLNLLDI